MLRFCVFCSTETKFIRNHDDKHCIMCKRDGEVQTKIGHYACPNAQCSFHICINCRLGALTLNSGQIYSAKDINRVFFRGSPFYRDCPFAYLSCGADACKEHPDDMVWSGVSGEYKCLACGTAHHVDEDGRIPLLCVCGQAKKRQAFGDPTATVAGPPPPPQCMAPVRYCSGHGKPLVIIQNSFNKQCTICDRHFESAVGHLGCGSGTACDMHVCHDCNRGSVRAAAGQPPVPAEQIEAKRGSSDDDNNSTTIDDNEAGVAGGGEGDNNEGGGAATHNGLHMIERALEDLIASTAQSVAAFRALEKERNDAIASLEAAQQQLDGECKIKSALLQQLAAATKELNDVKLQLEDEGQEKQQLQQQLDACQSQVEHLTQELAKMEQKIAAEQKRLGAVVNFALQQQIESKAAENYSDPAGGGGAAGARRQRGDSNNIDNNNDDHGVDGGSGGGDDDGPQAPFNSAKQGNNKQQNSNSNDDDGAGGPAVPPNDASHGGGAAGGGGGGGGAAQGPSAAEH